VKIVLTVKIRREIMIKHCYSCGDEIGLEEFKNFYLKTHGNPVFVKKGFICKKCKWRVICKS
jgi:hypothetical protein